MAHLHMSPTGTIFPRKSGYRTRTIPPCVASWSPDLKWPWQLLEQGQYTWPRAKLPKHTVNYGAPVWVGEMPKMLELTFQKPERLGSHSEVFKWVNFSRKLRTIHCYYRFYGSDVKLILFLRGTDLFILQEMEWVWLRNARNRGSGSPWDESSR